MFTLPAMLSSLLAGVGAVLAVRLLLWWIYRPVETVTDDALPHLAVVVPARASRPSGEGSASASMMASMSDQSASELLVFLSKVFFQMGRKSLCVPS